LSGHVADIDTELPLAGVAVTILDGANASHATSSDAAGSFRLGDLRAGGFTVRLRVDGYDSVFRNITFVADTAIDVRMTPAMRTLAGTWTGTLVFTSATAPQQSVAIPQLTVSHAGGSVSSSFNTSGPYQGSFDGTLADPSSITTGSAVAGTMTMTIDFSGRGPLTCKGAGDFTGSVNWTEMTMTAPRISFECGVVYTNVTFALARQQ